jgi:PBP1b-binding outer membrane lipoprotein LpoB
MKQIIIYILAILIFTGCSSKKQVNPLPENNKKIIPEREIVLTNSIDKIYADDFNSYANAKLKREKGIEPEKNLWDIGIERGHR